MSENPDVFASLMSEESRKDLYPIYERYRSVSPIVDTGLGVWFLFSYEDCLALLRDKRVAVDERLSIYPPERTDPLPLLIKIDPPDHERLRRLVQMAFTPRRVDALKVRAAELVEQALDSFVGRDQVDLIEEIAYPMPLTIICEMLGIESDMQPQLREWSTWMARSIDPSAFRTPELNERIAESERQFVDHMSGVIAQRRLHPGDDLLSQLVVAEMDGDRLSEPELLGLATLILVAGHETTVSLIGNGMYALLNNPSEFNALRVALAAEPGDVTEDTRSVAVRIAIDELLRFDSPVQMTVRVALEPIEVSGVTIPTGNIMVLMLGAANRDPAVFDDPSTLNVRVKRNYVHVAFGNGIHHCLGAALARAEAEAAIAGLVGRYPAMTLLAEPKLRPTFVLRGRVNLLVRLVQ